MDTSQDKQKSAKERKGVYQFLKDYYEDGKHVGYSCNHPVARGKCEKIWLFKTTSGTIDTSNVNKHMKTHEKESGQQLLISTENKKRMDNALVESIIMDMESFEGAVTPYKKAFYKTLNPYYSAPTTKTIKRMVNTMYDSSMKNLEANFKEVKAIWIDFDAWTSDSQQYMMTINMHTMKKTWELSVVNLDTVTFKEVHKEASVKAAAILSILEEFEIDQKFIGVISDGAELSVAKELGKSSIWCNCHLMNLAICDTLFKKNAQGSSENEMLIFKSPTLHKVKELVKRVRRSNVLSKILHDKQEEYINDKKKQKETNSTSSEKEITQEEDLLGWIVQERNKQFKLEMEEWLAETLIDYDITMLEKLEQMTKPLKLILDCPTRWNSTYWMLSRINFLKIFIEQLYTNKDWKNLPSLSDNEWKFVKDMVELLAPLEKGSDLLSGEKYVTSSLAIPCWLRMLNDVQTVLLVTTEAAEIRAQLVQNLKTRFIQVWSRPEFFCAMIFDPRHVLLLKLMEMDVEKAYCDAKKGLLEEYKPIKRRELAIIQQNREKSTTPAENTKKRKLHDIYEFVVEDVDDSEEELDTEWDRWFVFCKEFVKQDKSLLRDFKIEQFWKNNTEFPVMKALARIYLGMPACSTTSERIFSVAGQIFTKRRNRLAPELANKLIFLKMNHDTIECDERDDPIIVE